MNTRSASNIHIGDSLRRLAKMHTRPLCLSFSVTRSSAKCANDTLHANRFNDVSRMCIYIRTAMSECVASDRMKLTFYSNFF